MRARPLALKRATGNLLDNAIFYGARAAIAATQHDERVHIAIRDNGPGVAPAELERMAQPHVRLEHGRSHNPGGLGLGIGIAQGIVEAHGGALLFRNHREGRTLALTIVVNTPGGEMKYAQLEHARWHGFTLTDLVFPSFLFVVGAAMRLSMNKFAGQGDAFFLRRVLKRGLLIFVCGYVQSWFPFFGPAFEFVPPGATRIMGVLQRIGLCYVIASLIVRHGGLRGAALYAAAALPGTGHCCGASAIARLTATPCGRSTLHCSARVICITATA